MLTRSIATKALAISASWTQCLLQNVASSSHYVRCSASLARGSQPPDSRVIVLTLPMLSPSMTHACLSGWAKKQGDLIDPYDLVYELETESLTEEAYKMGDFAGRVAMEIELVEDAYLARQLLPVSSKMLPVGTPIGLLCENDSDTKEVAQYKLPADFNEYSDEYAGQYRIASWQSYLKERKVEPSSGCM